MENCLKCGTPLEVSNDKGRPKTYCSTACCRAAELEIRRADQRLAALEKDAMNYRLGRGMVLGKNMVEKVDAEIKRTEERLKLLLSAEPG